MIMTLLPTSSCPPALLRFTNLKAFSNYLKARSPYSIFFSMGNNKFSNVFDVLCILLARLSLTLVKYLWNSFALWLFFFIALPLTITDLINLLELSLFYPLISFIIFHVPFACHFANPEVKIEEMFFFSFSS